MTVDPGSRPAPLRARAAMRTDLGLVRERNEDAAHVDDEGWLVIVADGMGGAAAGEVASATAVEVVRRRLEAARPTVAAYAAAPSRARRAELEVLLAGAVRGAHQAVRERARREPDKHGMGTTLDVVVIAGAEAFVAHVGDTRTYLVRGGRAAQLTRDHSLAQVQVAAGVLTPEEATRSPAAAVLVNAVGVSAEIAVDVIHQPLAPGDRLLVCSDGLYDRISPGELAGALAAGGERGVAELVAMARRRGGHDNITGAVVELTADAAARARDRDEITTPVRLARGSAPPATRPTAPMRALPAIPAPAHPFAGLSDDALGSIVEGILREDSGRIARA